MLRDVVRRRLPVATVIAMFFLTSPACALERAPSCRLDNSLLTVVADTLHRAVEAYSSIGKALAIETVEVNATTPSANAKTLIVYVVLDASQGDIDAQGCAKHPAQKGEFLDALSVRGGCVVVAVDKMEIRCSSDAVKIFANVSQRSGRASPALLYVLAHELAHLYQRRLGEYAGRTEKLDLSWDRATKLKALQDACDPASTRHEEEADAIALQILAQLLAAPPYREPLFSERGSLYWNIDQLALASDAWQKAALEREFLSQTKVHPAFVPTEFPTPTKVIE